LVIGFQQAMPATNWNWEKERCHPQIGLCDSL
jgi:hypothetical protein